MIQVQDAIIIGAGPAGLFCADELVKQGVKKILVLDMGQAIESRKCPETEECNCKTCSILEGQGGAGGFSDGKMTLSLGRGTQQEEIFKPEHQPILDYIDEVTVKYGGEGRYYNPGEIETDMADKFSNTKLSFSSYRLRHVGSDGARAMIEGHIRQLESQGVKFINNIRVGRLFWSSENRIGSVGFIKKGESSGGSLKAKQIIVATGLQGAAWFENELLVRGIQLGTGPAGFGMRLETPAEVLAPLFEAFYDFKVEYTASSLLSLRSFCCNHKGSIVNENHHTMGIRNVNGHSYLAENLRTKSSNFSIMSKIHQGYDGDNPQDTVRSISSKVNLITGGMPMVESVRDFVNNSMFPHLDENPYRTNHQAVMGDIRAILPPDLGDAFTEYLMDLDKVVPGVLGKHSLLYAPEMKYYGRKVPVDFETWRVKGTDNLYALGNASGYIDSFTSAAVTGVLAARDVASRL